jgi:SAM-dependent MidA family methyltransferase
MTDPVRQPDDGWRPWRDAMAAALYGPAGFYRRPEGPAGHFRTSTHASDAFAGALVRLARDAGLDRLVDLGAGRGELLAAARRLDPGLELHGVEVVPRPEGLPAEIGWSERIPSGTTALVVANEWLDVVPLNLVEVTDEGPRLVLVEQATGRERPGGPCAPEERAWLETWWPLAGAAPGARAEIGLTRDRAWGEAVAALRRGIAVAVDYGHLRESRPPLGTLTGYRYGREVPPVPDGAADLTAHVATDACAEAGRLAGVTGTVLTTQRAALHALGVRGARPPLALASTDPAGYLRGLSAAGEAAELTARGGLGDFHWLVQAIGMPLPDPVAALPPP